MCVIDLCTRMQWIAVHSYNNLCNRGDFDDSTMCVGCRVRFGRTTFTINLLIYLGYLLSLTFYVFNIKTGLHNGTCCRGNGTVLSKVSLINSYKKLPESFLFETTFYCYFFLKFCMIINLVSFYLKIGKYFPVKTTFYCFFLRYLLYIEEVKSHQFLLENR